MYTAVCQLIKKRRIKENNYISERFKSFNIFIVMKNGDKEIQIEIYSTIFQIFKISFKKVFFFF